jgi:RNA polymerase sigma-70 factor (ECF subfamily)
MKSGRRPMQGLERRAEAASSSEPEPWPGPLTLRMEREAARTLAERYDEVLRGHGAALRRVAAVYERDPALREDLFQEICLALWQALPRFEERASMRTFAFRIAHNRGLSHRWRRRASPAGALDDVAEPADPAPDPEAAATRGQRRERLHEAVGRLPLKHRQVVALTLEGLTQAEIAEVLGITENSVAVRVTRARQSLREMLGAEEKVS